jgi:GTPase SAR1 family protein
MEKISQYEKRPTVVLVIGMAGSGKTTFMQRLSAQTSQSNLNTFLINLDPAVHHVPYSVNIDIRDTINYVNVMRQYNLGPNGSIITSLNLFATKFEQVLSLCDKQREPQLSYIFVDTPGQIEVFTWSASGNLITEALATTFPSIITFIVDTPRCQNPKTFISNMLQACSILYRTRLPLLLVFNKCDVVGHRFAIEWIQDSEKFHMALDDEESYSASLSRSLSLVLDEFYKKLVLIGVSAMTGLNIDRLIKSIDTAREEYINYYLPDLITRQNQTLSMHEKKEQHDLKSFQEELNN